jgi:cytochrome P450
MKTIGISSASKYIPLMIEKCRKYSDKWAEGETIDFSEEMKGVTFEIIADILFGENVTEKIGNIKYKKLDGTFVEKDLQEFFMTLTRDTFSAPTKILSIMFPILLKKNWFSPNNVIYENIQNLWKTLRSYFDSLKDDRSVYSQVLAMDSSIDKELLMRDMILFYFAGHDTSSRAISSLVYFVKKYPVVHKKLVDEIKTSVDLSDPLKVLENVTVSKLDTLEYLSNVIKETFRFDNPASVSLGYKALEPVRICGVPIPKNAKIFLNIHANHYSPVQWQCPEKYIPERFDPESEFYSPPEEKARSPYAFLPFSFGLRN